MRLHLFELGDQTWLPSSLRHGVVETLRVLTDRFRPYGESLQVFADLVAREDPAVIVDLCSGAGGPWSRFAGLLEARGCRPRMVLTDIHPVPERLAPPLSILGGVEVRQAPVDARSVPEELHGMRTMFNALHHFRPREVAAIFRDAAEAGQPIACIEITERRAASCLAMVLVSMGALAVGPWLPPRRTSRFLWTYGIGGIPLVTLIDGVLSCLRSYRPEELLEIAREAAPGYDWEVGRGPATWLPLRGTWIVGRPSGRS